MNSTRQARYDAFHEVRQWMRRCTRRELREKLDAKLTALADEEHTCQDCGDVFETKMALAGHRQKHIAEEQDPVTCDICGETFDNEWGYVGHQQKHLSGDDAIACGICGEEYRNKSDFNVHKQYHLQARNDPVTCDDCGMECQNVRGLKIHRSNKHGKATGDDGAAMSAEAASTKADVLYALRQKGYRPVAKIAEEYGVSSEYVRNLRQGIAGEEGIICLLCGDTFNTKKGVGNHLHITHNKRGKRIADRFAVSVQKEAVEAEA